MTAPARPAAAACVCLAAVLGTSRHALTDTESARVTVTGLTVDAMAEPLGIDELHPRLAWRLQSAQRGVMQTAYRVLAASRPVTQLPVSWRYLACAIDTFHGKYKVSGVVMPRMGG